MCSDRERMSGLQYEFPNGYCHDFVEERLRITESLFDTSHLHVIIVLLKRVIRQSPFQSSIDASSVIPMAQIVATSINMCDIDVRPAMFNGILVAGGNSLLNGFVERLQHELVRRCPSVRFESLIELIFLCRAAVYV